MAQLEAEGNQGFVQTDSYRSIVVEIVFDRNPITDKRAAKAAKGANVPFTPPKYEKGAQILPQKYLESLDFEMGLDTSWELTLNLFDPDWEFIESYLYIALPIEVRFGWYGALSPVVRTYMKQYSPTFQNEGAHIEIKAAGEEIVLGQQAAMTASWPEGTCPSDVVRELAGKFGWGTAENGYDTIEQSKPVKRPILMKATQVMSFIKCELMPTAYPASGEGAYSVWITPEKVIHFHTQKYLAAGRLSREYVFAKGKMGQVLSFEPKDISATIQALGGKAMEVKGNDSKNKGGTKVKLTDEKRGDAQVVKPTTFDGQKNRPRNSLSKAEKAGLVTNEMNRVFLRPFRDLNDLENYARSRYHKYMMPYEATLKVMGDPFIQLQDLVSVTVILPNGGLHYLSGVFQVMSVKHHIAPGEFTTDLGVMKSTALEGELALDTVTNALQSLIGKISEAVEERAKNEKKGIKTKISIPTIVSQVIGEAVK